MTKQHEFKLEPGTWVAQDADGSWYHAKSEPFFGHVYEEWFAVFGQEYLLQQPPNPNWRETKHQIEPGEVIYLEEE